MDGPDAGERQDEKRHFQTEIHAATTYKLYVFYCICLSSGMILVLKFPEMHSLGPGVHPMSFNVYGVYGLSIRTWKIVHILSSLAILALTILHMYCNRDWITKVEGKKLNLR